ncbi:MAG TPA: hypothetical protein VM680_18920, partial [Verrucomicrobiae bacterium]|nr:hypothetical protein [Verrucomicrobiae bacterium]
MTFFNGRLFASTAFGLLEIDRKGPFQLFSWDGDEIAAACVSSGGDFLYCWLGEHRSIARFDGKSWHTEYRLTGRSATRGDLFAGVGLTTHAKALWFVAEGRAFEASGGRVREVPLPKQSTAKMT